MGKDDFLKLLVTQIKNQDPLNPMDNTAFTAQMAQFSSLEQLMNVNTNLNSLLTASNSATSVQAMSLIGKEVTASGQNVEVKNGSASAVTFDLASNANSVSIQVEDSNGNVVRTINSGARNSGSQSITWDGKDDNGKTLSDGLYKYSVTAKDVNGADVNVTTYSKGVVDSVTFDGGTAYLHIGDAKYMLSEVTAVSNPTTASSSTSSYGSSSTKKNSYGAA